MSYDSILEVGAEPDISLLEQICTALQNPLESPQTRDQADGLINQFKERPDSYQYVPAIIQQSTNKQLVTTAYIILANFCELRWETPSEGEKAGIREFIISQFDEVVVGNIPEALHGYVFIGHYRLDQPVLSRRLIN